MRAGAAGLALFLIELIGVTLVDKTMQVSDVRPCDVSPVRPTVRSPLGNAAELTRADGGMGPGNGGLRSRPGDHRGL